MRRIPVNESPIPVAAAEAVGKPSTGMALVKDGRPPSEGVTMSEILQILELVDRTAVFGSRHWLSIGRTEINPSQ